MLTFGQTYPLKKGVEVKLKSFFHYKRERESEFTYSFMLEMLFLSLML